jgi:hypothetical protein
VILSIEEHLPEAYTKCFESWFYSRFRLVVITVYGEIIHYEIFSFHSAENIYYDIRCCENTETTFSSKTLVTSFGDTSQKATV